VIAFKAQTRLWGYNLKTSANNDELTNIRVDSVKDDTPAAQDATPLAAEREWQQQAEDNVIERLERAGLVSPEGDVDKILQTVVNNIEITNNIELPRPVRTRVMTTLPLETFSVGNTIVVSRGSSTCCPMKVAWPWSSPTNWLTSFWVITWAASTLSTTACCFPTKRRTRTSDSNTFPKRKAAADKKAIEMLKASPYAQKLESAGLFIKALQARTPQLTALLQAHLGNSFTENGTVTRMAALATSAPALDINKLDQIAALPWADASSSIRGTTRWRS